MRFAGVGAEEKEEGLSAQEKREKETTRRDRLIAFRSEMIPLLKVLGPTATDCGNVVVESIPAPWKYFGRDEAHAPRLLFKGFRNNSNEIEDALDGRKGVVVEGTAKKPLRTYDYDASLVLTLRICDAEAKEKNGSVLSSAIVVVHDQAIGKVFEITFLSTIRILRNRGYGSLLFDYIQRLAALRKAHAVCVAATSSSFAFWCGLRALAKGRVMKEVMSLRTVDQILERARLEEHEEKRLRDLVSKRNMSLTGDCILRKSVFRYYHPNGREVSVSGGGAPPLRRSVETAHHLWFVLPPTETIHIKKPPCSVWKRRSQSTSSASDHAKVKRMSSSDAAKLLRKESRRDRKERRRTRKREASLRKMRLEEEKGSRRKEEKEQERRRMHAREVRWVHYNEYCNDQDFLKTDDGR